MILSLLLSFIAVFIYYIAFESGGFKRAFFVRILVYIINFIALGNFK